MDASRDQLDRVDQSRLVESGGARDDSLSCKLSRGKQGDAIRVESTIHGVEGKCASVGASITETCAAAKVMTDEDLWKSEQLQ